MRGGADAFQVKIRLFGGALLRFFCACWQEFDTVYEIAISTHFNCNRWLQNGNRNFFGQLKTLAAALFFVEKSVENVKNT